MKLPQLPRWATLLIVALVLTNLATVGILVLGLRLDRWNWRAQMYGMTWYAATLQAARDYDSGRMRLLEPVQDGKIEPTGRTEGPFEVWAWPAYADPKLPGISRPGEYATEIFVSSYNRHMKKLSKAHRDETQSDAEQSSPVHVEDGAPEK